MAAANRNDDASAATRVYLEERRVTELFECLTAALVHERPDEPIDFLLKCLDRAADVGYQNVFWDTFLPKLPPISQRAPLRSPSKLKRKRPESSLTYTDSGML